MQNSIHDETRGFKTALNIKIYPSKIKGQIYAPTSKSAGHRALILASIAGGRSRLIGDFSSSDLIATQNALIALGAKIEKTKNGVTVCPIERSPEFAEIDCGESGSTLRFILPLAAALGTTVKYSGEGRLGSRPIKPLLDILGVKSDYIGAMPFTVEGGIDAKEYNTGDVNSSQFVSGMLFALLALKRPIKLTTGEIKSRPYVDLTVKQIAEFGASIAEKDGVFYVDGSSLSGRDYTVEGDYSGAAFMLALGAIGGRVEVKNLGDSMQGDRVIIDILKNMGADVVRTDDGYICKKAELKAIDFDLTDYPDLAPIASVLASYAKGTSTFYGVDRLKDKESDRLRAIEDMLYKTGIEYTYSPDVLKITGGVPSQASLSGYGDHRMVMSAAVNLSVCGGSVSDGEAVAKSYASFFDDFKKVGGNYVV